MTLTIGSLFSGYAGLDTGVGMVLPTRTIWHSDIKPAAVKLLAHRFPDVPNLGDITTVDWASVERPDIITGGSPCQDLSHAGRRGGMKDGTRSNLWVAMREAIAQLRPALVVWENVRGAYSAPADSAVEPEPGRVGDGAGGPVLTALGRVLGDLSDLRYDTAWCGLRAADVGAPHGRFRIFLTAWPTPDTENLGHERGGRARQRWAGPTDGDLATAYAGHRGITERPRTTWREAVERAPVGSEPGSGGDAAADTQTVAGRLGDGDDLRARRGEGRHRPATVQGAVADTADDHRDGRADARTASWRQGMDWGAYAPAIRRWESVLGRPAPAPTELGAKGGQRLSPWLTEWLMGLPGGWICAVPGLSRADKLSLAGDGVVPQQAAEALRRMLPMVGSVAA